MIIPIDAPADVNWLIYISKSRIQPDHMRTEIAGIVEASCWRNTARGISGALVATPIYLAQYIEGPGETAERLAAHVARDARHSDFRIMARGTRPERLFPDWSMAYSGGSVFIERAVTALAESAPPGFPPDVDRVIRLMREFCHPRTAEGSTAE